jgi:hypothetical protein
MLTLLRVAPFAALLLLGIVVVATRWRRWATNAFILFFVAASCVAGFAQRDLWPFSPYPVIAESGNRWRESVWYEARAVDRLGREHPLDPSPLSSSALDKWIGRSLGSLASEQRRTALKSILASNNEALCSNDRLLGPLAAPGWLVGRRDRVRDAQAVRIYRHDVTQATLVYEYRQR